MTISKLPTSASLKQVMDKFEEISLQDFSSIDIIAKSELPEIVKNGQIIIITENKINNIILNYKQPSNLEENDIFIKYFNYDKKQFDVESNNKKISLQIFGVEQYINSKLEKCDAYIGVSDEWVSMNNLYIVYSDNSLDITNTFNLIVKDNSNGLDSFSKIIDNTKINLYMDSIMSNSLYVKAVTKECIDLTIFKTLYVDAEITSKRGSSWDSSSKGGKFKFGIVDRQAGKPSDNFIASKQTNTTYERGIHTLDISNIEGEYHIDFRNITSTTTGIETVIYNAWLE